MKKRIVVKEFLPLHILLLFLSIVHRSSEVFRKEVQSNFQKGLRKALQYFFAEIGNQRELLILAECPLEFRCVLWPQNSSLCLFLDLSISFSLPQEWCKEQYRERA